MVHAASHYEHSAGSGVSADRESYPALGTTDVEHAVQCIMSAVHDGRVHADPETEAWVYALASAGHSPLTLPRLVYVHVGKRILDICMTLALCVAVIPICLLVALMIRITTREPILFRQTRIGLAGKPFTVLKFRTMVDDRRQRAENISFPDRRQRHKSNGDPRVTRIGAFLRRTSLDELPQLINVLRGEMSLVGPRPELPMIVANYEDWQHVRHLVRPGITGWWQVNGRSDRPMHENTGLDIEYVQCVSLWMDLTILLHTIRVVLVGRGAF